MLELLRMTVKMVESAVKRMREPSAEAVKDFKAADEDVAATERIFFVRHARRLSGRLRETRETSAIHLDLTDKILSVCRDMREIVALRAEFMQGFGSEMTLRDEEAPG